MAQTESCSGANRLEPALRWRSQPSTRSPASSSKSPFTSTAEVAAAIYWFMPVRLLMKDQFHSDERIARVTAPVLIMHGERDATVPIGYGEELFGMITAPKQFVRFPEGAHNNLDAFGALDAVRAFLRKL